MKVYPMNEMKAMLEDVYGQKVLHTVERTEHYNYLLKKFGPRSPAPETNEDKE